MDQKIFKVSEFTEFINVYLGQVGEVVVEGEISEIKLNQKKWVFITIKDEISSVDVFSVIDKIYNFDSLQEGMLVHVYGTPNLYPKTGRFSIYASQIKPAGKGALKIAFEKLKLKLEKEGLFSNERKRSLPLFPEKIGLITAKGSRAYSDFIKVLSHRMGGLKIYFYPVSVQGKNSAFEIVSAFEYFNEHLSDLDVLVLTRGGGSLEDLQAFNDEKVARAIFSSKIPVVCGVGHEKDISLADLVSDVRASTPSNAAELVVRRRNEVKRQIDFFISQIEKPLIFSLEQKQNQLYNYMYILDKGIKEKIYIVKNLIFGFRQVFRQFTSIIEQRTKDVSRSQDNLIKTAIYRTQQTEDKINALERLLKSLDFRNVLRRGFSITYKNDGEILKSIKNIERKDSIKTTLFNGTIYSEVYLKEGSNE